MKRRNRARLINGILAAVSFIGGVFANIATGTLPDKVKDYSWVFWVLTLVFLGAVAWLTFVSTDGPDTDASDTSQRRILLRRVGREIQFALEDRIPAPLPALDQRFNVRSLPLPRPGLRLEHARRRLPVGPVVPADVFADEGGLLLLGAPGAGKTTELWLFAQRLHTQAMGERYAIGRDLAQQYLDTQAVTLLLDGLDEVDVERRSGCVSELNTFANLGQRALAVCSRLEEYDPLQQELTLPAMDYDCS